MFVIKQELIILARTRFYRLNSDIPDGIPKDDILVIYEELRKKRTITEKSITGTGFNDLAKIDMAIKIMEDVCFKQWLTTGWVFLYTQSFLTY